MAKFMDDDDDAEDEESNNNVGRDVSNHNFGAPR
jgi:hypothetical protein